LHIDARELHIAIPVSPDRFASGTISLTCTLIRVHCAYWKSIKKMHATVYNVTNALITWQKILSVRDGNNRRYVMHNEIFVKPTPMGKSISAAKAISMEVSTLS
jgi:hypothetical protein